MSIAQALNIVIEGGFLVAHFDMFNQGGCSWEPSPEGMIITFNDGSRARYDDGDYFVL